MSASADENHAVALNLIDQKEVTADMAFPMVGPVSL